MAIQWMAGDAFTCLSTDTKPTLVPAQTKAIETDTDDTYKFNGTSWALVSGAGGGGGLSAGGQISFSGNASQTVFNIPHGLSQTPDFISVEPASTDAFGSFTSTKTSSNIVITYQIPPPLGSSNVTFQWGAGDVNAATGGLTATSTTTLTGKTLNFSDNTFPNLATPAYYTVYKQTADSIVKCRNNISGIVESSSATQEVPIQYAIDNGLRKSIYIGPGTYNFSAGFTGLIFPQSWSETRITLDPGAELKVPQGYAGSCLAITQNCGLLKIRGGKWSEQGTPANLWTCFKFVSDAPTGTRAGINSCTIGECYVRFPKIVIELLSSTSDGWINSCTFHDIFADRFQQAVFFNQSFAKGPDNGMALNQFVNCIFQCHDSAPISTFGIRNICGAANSFVNVAVWDMPVAGTSSNITVEGTGTIIVGGKMTTRNFVDLGKDTEIFEFENGIKLGKSNFGQNRGLMGAVTQPWATVQGTGITGDGLLSNATNITETGTVTDNAVYADGHYRRYTTGSVANDNAGYRFHTMPITFRGWMPYYETKFRISATSNVRLWVGWQSGNTEPTGDNAFGTGVLTSAIGVGFRTTDTNFQLFRNNGGAATTYTDSFAIAKNTAIHTVRILGNDTAGNWQVYLDDASITTSSNVPAQTTGLYPFMHIETTDTTPKSIDRFALDVKPKNVLL